MVSLVGSGVLVSADGKVVTAAHIVQAADEVTVEFAGGVRVPSRVVASEPEADAALLQLATVPAGAAPAALGVPGQPEPSSSHNDHMEGEAMAKDPVCGMNVDDEKATAASATYQGKAYYFCSSGCKATFDKAPAKYATS